MLAEMIRAEWERRRAALLVVTLLYAMIPAMYAARLLDEEMRFGRRMHYARIAAPLLAWALVLAAVAWGLGTWAPERKERWTYFLSLPTERVRLFASRYLASLVWLVVPVAALLAGSLVAAAAVPRPVGVYAYPLAFTAWGALVTWLFFSLGFFLSLRFESPWAAFLLPLGVLFVLVALSGYGLVPALRPVVVALATGGWSPLAIFEDIPLLFGY